MKHLVRDHPELCAAKKEIVELYRSDSELGVEYEDGSLLSVGRASVDHGTIAGPKNRLILAMPCGDAGHILRLVLPGIDQRNWGKQNCMSSDQFKSRSPQVSVLNLGCHFYNCFCYLIYGIELQANKCCSCYTIFSNTEAIL